MILAKQCCLTYKDGTEALKPFDLLIESNEMVYVTGPSGSGKTSLMKLMMGLVSPSGGTFDVFNTPMNKATAMEIQTIRRKVGPIFQEFRLIEGRTALENVLLSMRFLDFTQSQMKKNAIWALDRVGLEAKISKKVDKMSWGERQRVAIARAVARQPQLIIADEPTGNLDHDNAVNILNLLMSFKSESTSIIITTHATHLIQPTEKDQHIIMNAGVMSGGSHV